MLNIMYENTYTNCFLNNYEYLEYDYEYFDDEDFFKNKKFIDIDDIGKLELNFSNAKLSLMSEKYPLIKTYNVIYKNTGCLDDLKNDYFIVFDSINKNYIDVYFDYKNDNKIYSLLKS